jgi:hypothetical protein
MVWINGYGIWGKINQDREKTMDDLSPLVKRGVWVLTRRGQQDCDGVYSFSPPAGAIHPFVAVITRLQTRVTQPVRYHVAILA